MLESRSKGFFSQADRSPRGAGSTVVLRGWRTGSDDRPRRGLALALVVGAALVAVALSAPARSAGAQQATPPRSSKLREPELLCDTTPVKLVRRTPVKPKALAAGHRVKKVAKPVVVAKAPVRKPRPTVAKAAGHRVRPRAVAPRKPNCVKAAAAPVAPTPEAKQALVAALPWTTPTEVAVPELSPFSLPGTIGSQSKAWALGLAGLSAFYFVGPERTESPEIIPPPTVTPEPASIALLATGLAALGAGARIRRRRSRTGR